jgi:pimeloyl-ACP methyl ester carboxylesterase
MNNTVSIILSLLFLFLILLILFLVLIKIDNRFRSKDFLTRQLNTRWGNFRPKIPDYNKKNHEWNYFYFQGGKPPLNPPSSLLQYHSSTPLTSVSKGGLGHVKLASAAPIPYVFIPRGGDKYLIICHGAAFENEYCYEEWKNISEEYDISVICVEYPGFGQRSNEILTEDKLLNQYPNEIVDLVENHLCIPWTRVFILGQCLGAPIAIKLASLPRINDKIRGLYLTKPFSSLHNAFQSLPSIFSKFFTNQVTNLLETSDQILETIKAPVKCMLGENDKICTVPMTKKLLGKMKQSSDVQFFILPNAGHWALMETMLGYIKMNHNVVLF